MKILELSQLSFRYPNQPRAALKNISLSIRAGEIVYVCGPTGSGKSTLLRCLKREIRPAGEMAGKILYTGRDLDTYSSLELIRDIGMVFQDPEEQTVMDTVMGEMAFGLENMGLATGQIRQRLSETAGYLGLEGILPKSLKQLSGGEKQKVNLGAVLAMRPKLLLLDEPLAQLDPVAQMELIDIIQRINRDFGITIIIAEHNRDELMAMADQMLILNEGRPVRLGKLRQLADEADPDDLEFMPVPVRLFAPISLSPPDVLPLTVREARSLLAEYPGFKPKNPVRFRLENPSRQPVLEADNVLFAYRGDPGRIVLKHLDFQVHAGDFVGIAGGNGAGKSTLLKILCGLLEPLDGRVRVGGRSRGAGRRDLSSQIFYIPQNPLTYFTHDRVGAEIDDAARLGGVDPQAHPVLEELQLHSLLEMHPYDLSGGERQKVLFACAVLRGAQILLLDEATKGLDAQRKKQLGDMLTDLVRTGKTVVLAGHDLEFMARYAQKCTLLFDGQLSNVQPVRDFFRDNYFYATVAGSIFREALPGILTIEEVTWDG